MAHLSLKPLALLLAPILLLAHSAYAGIKADIYHAGTDNEVVYISSDEYPELSDGDFISLSFLFRPTQATISIGVSGGKNIAYSESDHPEMKITFTNGVSVTTPATLFRNGSVITFEGNLEGKSSSTSFITCLNLQFFADKDIKTIKVGNYTFSPIEGTARICAPLINQGIPKLKHRKAAAFYAPYTG